MRLLALACLARSVLGLVQTASFASSRTRQLAPVRESPFDFVGELLEKAAAPPGDGDLRPGSFGVVITGGAAGVGYAYADEFVRRGHRVMICDIVDPAKPVAALKAKHGDSAQIFGAQCDVSSATSVRDFAEQSRQALGTIDYWVNNAGINGGRRPFMDVPDEVIQRVVNVNMFGVMICSKVAMEVMQSQAGVTGHVFNTVGSGVRGGGTPGYVTYGAAKRGLPQMTDSLVAELEGKTQGYELQTTPGTVKVHTLSPGMVFTDLLLKDSTPELRKFPFSVLAATPEEVAQDLVPKILATENQGSFVEYLSKPRTFVKFFNRFVKQQKSDIIDDDGNVIRKEGVEYNEDGVRALY